MAKKICKSVKSRKSSKSTIKNKTKLTLGSNDEPKKGKVREFKKEIEDFYLEFGNKGAVTDKIIENFIDEQFAYMQKDKDCCHIHKYRIKRGVTRQMYRNWLAKNEYFQMMHERCLDLLGLRREEILKDYDANTLKHTLFKYSEDWDEADRRKAELRNKRDEKKETEVHVHFDSYGDKK